MCIRSGLFVDFDNVYLGLLDANGAEFAECFATQPLQWVSWIEDGLGVPDVDAEHNKRRVLIRRCYLNPRSFGRYRKHFVHAAFETVDCPPLTLQKKTSADMHIAVDILCSLLGDAKDMKLDEVIMMSADADFRRVLIELRKRDVRTTIVATGPSALAYRHAADLSIDVERFCAEALGISEVSGIISQEHAAEGLPGEKRRAYEERILEYVRMSHEPVTLASLAGMMRKEYQELCQDWAGQESFKGLLGILDLQALEISSAVPGYLYDPTRHEPPIGAISDTQTRLFQEKHPELFALAQDIRRITDTPFLLPEQYTRFLEIIAEEVNERGYQITRVSRNVRDTCRKEDIPVSRNDVNLVLRGISYQGHRFGEETERVEQLAALLVQNTLALCERSAFDLNEEETERVSHWIGHSDEP